MRIGLLTHSVNPRGGVVHVLELATALHRAGHDVTVFAPAAAGQTLFRPVPFRFAPVPLPAAAPHDTVALVAQRIAAFRTHLAGPAFDAFDVLHAHDPIGANALADLGRPFVRTVHHLDPFDEPRLAAWQARSVRAARGVFVVSALWQRVLRDDWGIAAACVPNGVDLERYRAAPEAGDAAVARHFGLRPGAPLWLAVGGIEERKNSLRALEAFVLHRTRHPQAQLVVAGGASLLDHAGCRARFDALRAAAGLAGGDAVVITGTVPDAAMPALYRLADGVLMPSLREGFGLVVLEALASLTPVVVSARAPFTEYLAADEAHWAEPEDTAAIAAAMQRALAAPPLRIVPAVCRRHAWPASAARHVALYRRLGTPHAADAL